MQHSTARVVVTDFPMPRDSQGGGQDKIMEKKRKKNREIPPRPPFSPSFVLLLLLFQPLSYSLSSTRWTRRWREVDKSSSFSSALASSFCLAPDSLESEALKLLLLLSRGSGHPSLSPLSQGEGWWWWKWNKLQSSWATVFVVACKSYVIGVISYLVNSTFTLMC